MLQRIKEARRNESGFTLIELLIVIVILGVLAGIVVFGVSAFNNAGVAAACKTDLKNAETASEAYYASHDSAWAPSTDVLVSDGYLKSWPNSTKYAINYNATTGEVTGNCPAT